MEDHSVFVPNVHFEKIQSRISFPTRSTNEISQRLILQMLPQTLIHIRSIR